MAKAAETECSEMSFDHNPTEMLWKNPKQSVHAKKPGNVPELKLFHKKE